MPAERDEKPERSFGCENAALRKTSVVRAYSSIIFSPMCAPLQQESPPTRS